MKWDDWQGFYWNIVERLNLSPDDDRAATKLLSSLLTNVDTASLLTKLDAIIRENIVVVCGAGPSLERHLNEIQEYAEYDNAVFVAVDGASTAFVHAAHHCEIVVTDLDGDINHIRALIDQGALGIVHAHGDNMDVVEPVVPMLGPVLGSTQVEPKGNIHLWGGFTDGDRACFIVTHYGPERVILAGMDFGTIVGRWSKSSHDSDFLASERKRVKLEIAQEMIALLRERGEPEFIIWN